MTQLEWLKQESGYTDEELKQFETVMGSAKFITMLEKIQQRVTAAAQEKEDAEKARLDLENRYQNEMIPELRKTATDAINAQGEAAKLRAQLKKAQEYGIVPDEPTVTPETPRAPGSPDPNLINRDEFGKFSQSQANTIIALNDLNAEHFRLFGAPLGNTQELVDEVTRQRTLGNKNFSLKQAWETKHNVAAKRTEMAAAEQKKHDDEIREATRREERERQGANPNLRRGQTSRFSNYKPSEAQAGKEPWKAAHGKNERNAGWRENAKKTLREAVA